MFLLCSLMSQACRGHPHAFFNSQIQWLKSSSQVLREEVPCMPIISNGPIIGVGLQEVHFPSSLLLLFLATAAFSIAFSDCCSLLVLLYHMLNLTNFLAFPQSANFLKAAVCSRHLLKVWHSKGRLQNIKRHLSYWGYLFEKSLA